MKRIVIGLAALCMLVGTPAAATQASQTHGAVQHQSFTLRIVWSNSDTTDIAGFNFYDGHKLLNHHLIPVRDDGNYQLVLHHPLKHKLTMHTLYNDGTEKVTTVVVTPVSTH